MSAERGLYALHMPTEVGGGGFSLTDMFFVHEAVYQHGIGLSQWMLSWTEGPQPDADVAERGAKTALPAAAGPG